MPFVRTPDGCRIHAETEGEGHPLLLIPGLGGSAAFWNPHRSLLRDGHRLILFDHRGAGRSDRPEQRYTIEALAEDVVSVLDHFGVERAHVVGHSTGGAIGQVLALDAADRVAGLVLSGTWDRADYRFRTLFAFRAAVLERMGPAAYQDLTNILGYAPDWVNAHAPDLERATKAAAADLEPIAVTAARIRMLLDFDRSAELHRIAAPTLVVSAEDDAMVPAYHAERLAAAIPGARSVRFAGGHFYPRVRPQAFADAVLNFLRSA
ncbi:alpha/beta fold hydrolase [Propylenella binzhouense]|uniref:Alpha/beta fold hydrolase n=1 Tax=Propylenella binzhouense TaxID=2555902 RepID=A0A964T355_9HYPH|nr:alpha/beta fold hydrolase [Propylenella binzhouense]MYZ47578.1 alpha/beta fold hydrolase [Propylenella binzhouense]